MRLLYSLIFLILIVCAVPFAQVLTKDFFLSDYANRDIKTRLDISVSPIQFQSDLVAYDMVKTSNPISYTGSILRPFSSHLPVILQHAVSLNVTRSCFSAGIQLAGNFRLVRSHIDNQNAIQSGSTIIDAISFQDINHLRTDFSATGNFFIQFATSQLSLSLSGNLIQHHGYELIKTPGYYYSSVYTLRDFDPLDLSGRVSAGLLYAVPVNILGNVMLNQIGVRGTYQNEDIPLRASGELNNFSQYDSFDWYGSRSDNVEGSLFIVSRPFRPENRSRRNMIYSGRYLYGIRLSEVSGEFLTRSLTVSNVRYSSNILVDSARLFFWETENQYRASRVKISPELFFASWLSCVLNLSGIADQKTFGPTIPWHTNVSQYLGAAGSIDLNFYHRWKTGKELVVSLNSGEITATTSSTNYGRTISYMDVYYRQYLLALKVSVIGLP